MYTDERKIKKIDWLVAGLLFLLPLLPALNISSGIDLAASRVLIGGLLVYFGVRSLVRGKLQIPIGVISLGLGLFLVWSSGSLLYSPVLERTARKLIVFINIFPLGWIIYSWLKEREDEGARLLLRVLAGAGLMMSGLGLIQFLAQFIWGKELIMELYAQYLAVFLWGEATAEAVKSNPSWLVNAGGRDILRALATLPDPHMLSYFLAFGVPAQSVLAIQKGEMRKRIFYACSAVLGLLVVFLTFSRGGYLGVLAAMVSAPVVFCLLTGKKKKRKKKEKRGGKWLIAGFITVIVAGGLFLVPQNPIRERLGSAFDREEGSNQGRLKIWGEAWDLFKEHPVRGVGLGAYGYEIKPAALYREPIYAHNLYLELLAEVGMIGLMFWLVVVVGAGGALVMTLKKGNREERILGGALLLSLIWFSVHSFFEMPIYSPVILPLWATLLGAASYLEERQEKKRKNRKNRLGA